MRKARRRKKESWLFTEQDQIALQGVHRGPGGVDLGQGEDRCTVS